MAPVDPHSLGPVLDLIERWQQYNPEWKTAKNHQINVALANLDVAACRQLAEQHAAQLRSVFKCNCDTEGKAAAADFVHLNWCSSHDSRQGVNEAAADFLSTEQAT